MKIKLLTFVILFGVFLVFLGFAYDLNFAGLPFQDPTPEMQANWDFHKNVAENIIFAGIMFFVAGCLLKIINVVRTY